MSVDRVKSSLSEAASALEALRSDEEKIALIDEASELIANALRAGGKVISCGNGGSMCDAMHFAEELTGRYRDDRAAYAAIAISDPSTRAPTRAPPSASTSGTSANVLAAAKEAKNRGMKVVALTGNDASALGDAADVHIATPGGKHSDRVQELHIKVIHILIELVEERLA